MNCLFWPSASKDEFLSLSQMFKLLLWASRQVRARVQTYNTFIQVLQVLMYHVTMSQSNINQSIIVQRHYAKRDLTPWRHHVFSPRSTGNSYRSSHILGRLTKHYLSLFLIDRSIFTSSTSSSLSHFLSRVCIGRTSGLVCDGVSDCIFGEDEDPQLCQTSSSHKAVPERK